MIIIPIIVIISVLAISVALFAFEMPRMRKKKIYRDLWTFSILLVIGVILTIIKCLNFTLPNPSDLIAWVFSPFSDFLRNIQK